jgi:hypothetical protein
VSIREFADGGYKYIVGVFQYSGGVAALDGYEIVRVKFRQPISLKGGFLRIDQYLRDVGRPRAALCACELRSPAPFAETNFKTFNELYVATLEDWGIFHQRNNPVARTNVCPEIQKPSEPEFHAFSYTIPSHNRQYSFIISGSGEVPEGKNNYRDHIIRLEDTSSLGLREKAKFVMSAMETRLTLLGFGWDQTTDIQIYTVYDLHPFFEDLILRRGGGRFGATWHYARPPVVGLDFEMDCREVWTEHML